MRAGGQQKQGLRGLLMAGLLVAAGCATTAGLPAGSTNCYARDYVMTDARRSEADCRRALANPDATVAQAANARFNLGMAEAALDQMAEAISAFEYVLVLDPARTDARIALARVHARRAEYDKALARLDQALQAEPSSPEALFERAETLARRGSDADLDRAMQDYESVIRVGGQKKEPGPLVDTARARLGEVAMAAGSGALRREPASRDSTLRALDAFRRARIARPDSAAAYQGCGAAALRMALYFNDPALVTQYNCTGDIVTSWAGLSLAAYRQADRLVPNDVAAVEGMARALQALGQSDDAVAYFARASALDPNSPARRLSLAQAQAESARSAQASGLTESALSRWRGAVDSYEQALRLTPGDGPALVAKAEAWLAIAGLARSRGQAADAEAARREALAGLEAARLAGYPGAYIRLGRFYFEEGPAQFDLARENFRRAEALAGAGDTATRAQALYYQSRIAVEDPRGASWGKALQAASAAMALDPTVWEYRAQACLSRIGMGDVGSEARLQCAGDGRTTPDAFVLQGIYHLRRAHFAARDDKKRAWEAAYRAFSDGLKAMAVQPASQRDEALRARLEVGQGIAYFCVGFPEIGKETIDATGALREQAQQYFDTYRVRYCDNR